MRRIGTATLIATAALLFGAACSHSTSNGGANDMATGGGGTGGTGGGGGTGGTGGGGGGGGGSGGTGGGGGGGGGSAGTGTVTGTIGGNMFGDVKQAWIIGKPDAATTTVIYLFSSPVDCHDAAIKFGMLAWDMNLPHNTQFMELKSYGTAVTPPTPPGDYTVTTAMNPIAGEASINHSLAPGGGVASNETIGMSGKITIATITAMHATGSFTVTFPSTNPGTLMGTFDAGYCDIGVEP